MTVVISSSRSSSESIMSNIENPTTPPGRVPGEGSEDTSGRTGGSFGVSFIDSSDSPINRQRANGTAAPTEPRILGPAVSRRIDEKFCAKHLLPYKNTNISLTPTMESSLRNITTTLHIEVALYPELTSFLTALSKAIYDSLTPSQQEDVAIRWQVPQGKPVHLQFIDSHSKAPSGFPILDVKERPDILGVANTDEFRDDKGNLTNIPHHRIETLIEVKNKDASSGRAQACGYAYRHQQCRPDHPAFLFLTAKSTFYQILLSEPSGVAASPAFPWTDLAPLQSYIYSLYVLPSSHFFRDDTITWSATTDSKGSEKAHWTIECAGELYTEARFIGKLGDAWGRRTSVFLAKEKQMDKQTDEQVDEREGIAEERSVVKEGYFPKDGRDEAELLDEIHAEGDIPGVVRLKAYEQVKFDGRLIQCGEGDEQRTKARLVLYDIGSSLERAISVNDILKVMYDVLESHRTVDDRRGILHRDMSIYNILMYPKWRKIPGRARMKDPPPFIDDLLSENPRSADEREANCLLIDYDHAARVRQARDASKALVHRTGTPKYISRSVSLGAVFISPTSAKSARMPKLTGHAYERYIAVRGKERYDAYTDSDGAHPTYHGGYPPPEDAFEYHRSSNAPPFRHRPEHDVESVFWTLFSVLVRVQPSSRPRETFVPAQLYRVWDDFNSHRILPVPLTHDDRRDGILGQTLEQWEFLFTPFPEMNDIARLLFDIARQVRPEYAMWDWSLTGGEPLRYHLHEAVQRLIFQYLFDHHDKDIPLDPKRLRPVKDGPSRPDDEKEKSARHTSNRARGSKGKMAATSQKGSKGSRSTHSGSFFSTQTPGAGSSNLHPIAPFPVAPPSPPRVPADYVPPGYIPPGAIRLGPAAKRVAQKKRQGATPRPADETAMPPPPVPPRRTRSQTRAEIAVNGSSVAPNEAQQSGTQGKGTRTSRTLSQGTVLATALEGLSTSASSSQDNVQGGTASSSGGETRRTRRREGQSTSPRSRKRKTDEQGGRSGGSKRRK